MWLKSAYDWLFFNSMYKWLHRSTLLQIQKNSTSCCGVLVWVWTPKHQWNLRTCRWLTLFYLALSFLTVRYLSSQQEHHRLPFVTEWDWECCDNRYRRCGWVSAVCSRHEFCYSEEPQRLCQTGATKRVSAQGCKCIDKSTLKKGCFGLQMYHSVG